MASQSARIEFDTSGEAKWAGMGDYVLVSPNKRHEVSCTYYAEPPHGDSIQTIAIGAAALPGYAWGRFFSFSPCSRYLAMSWMRKLFGDTKTIVVDLDEMRYFALPFNMHLFALRWPLVQIVDGGFFESYRFNGSECWEQIEPNNSFKADGCAAA